MKPVVHAIIPARYASTRFPGKPLALIAGVPMILRVLQQVKKCKVIDKVIVATDDVRIRDLVVQNGELAVLTDPNLESGSDRVWAEAEKLECDWVLNVQGDEPVISPLALEHLIVQTQARGVWPEMATLFHKIGVEELASPHIVKVLLNQFSEALYFSRFAIPFSRQNPEAGRQLPVYRHAGVYLYQKSALQRFCEAPPTDLERAESLEQLRALYLGFKIYCVESDHKSLGVDTLEDLAQVEAYLKATTCTP